jgi:50S ribosomal protein L16 3-hydroxylase
MLKLPDGLDAASFLARHWQKAPLFMPGARSPLRPSMTRNELAWLATLDDVESRIVFTERDADRVRYRAESGPFDADFLASLPKSDWTLLVHDVEKHLPALRVLFDLVPFIPDWRIDDLMVSFAAPGGGVGPHRDNYDVFLCQGIGVREWRISLDAIDGDTEASSDLALLQEFDGMRFELREGDVLYLPPGVPHWGTARRACMTYSIGMRAPQLADIAETLPDDEDDQRFYADPDLSLEEIRPGHISRQAVERGLRLLGRGDEDFDRVAQALGRCVTTSKDWLTPEALAEADVEGALRALRDGSRLEIHGMARIAWFPGRVYVNGHSRELGPAANSLIEEVCRSRALTGSLPDDETTTGLLEWMLEAGAFDIDGNL